ncbi:MAG: hypothetical protein JXA07_14635 [Spirochaetes bacterium]|nr:hypothetical protein [Spirochaetota bacterium]
MPKSSVKTPSFDVYKSIKDEIIEISEMRFENILTKKLNAFRVDFKKELMDELNPRFESIDSRFDAINLKFDAIDSRFSAMDSKFDAMNSRFDAVDSKFAAFDSKFGAIDTKFESMNAQFSMVKWSIWSMPVVMSVILAIFTLLLKFIVKL